jgi:hypothetical protein
MERVLAQNIYDLSEFFDGYSRLPRSVRGLDGAPEWVPILRASATFARFRPRRLATSIAQRLSVEKRVSRLSTASDHRAWSPFRLFSMPRCQRA